MCCCSCTSFREQPHFPFYLPLPRPCPVPWMPTQSSQAPCPAPWLQPSVDWSSSNHQVPTLSWEGTLGGKDLEDGAAFHAWECPFAAGMASTAVSQCSRKPSRGSSRLWQPGDEAMPWPNLLWAHRAQVHHRTAGHHDVPGIPSRLCTHRGVWKPSKQFLFLQPGPALTGPGFLKPCVSAPVSINWGGMSAATEDGWTGRQELLIRARELSALPAEPPCSSRLRERQGWPAQSKDSPALPSCITGTDAGWAPRQRHWTGLHCPAHHPGAEEALVKPDGVQTQRRMALETRQGTSWNARAALPVCAAVGAAEWAKELRFLFSLTKECFGKDLKNNI